MPLSEFYYSIIIIVLLRLATCKILRYVLSSGTLELFGRVLVQIGIEMSRKGKSFLCFRSAGAFPT